MSIAVCILNYNGKDILRKCVDSVLRQTRKPNNIFVIDNNSTDQSWKLVESDVSDIIHGNNKHGFITGLNLAFSEPKDDWIMFMENDVTLHATCISDMFYGGGDIISPILYNQNGYKYFTTPFCFPTACFMMRKSTFEFVGEFDKKLAPAYYEDIDYSIRAWKFGFSIKKNIGKAIHYANYSFSKVYSKNMMSGWCKKNFWYVLRKHLGFNHEKRVPEKVIQQSK